MNEPLKHEPDSFGSRFVNGLGYGSMLGLGFQRSLELAYDVNKYLNGSSPLLKKYLLPQCAGTVFAVASLPMLVRDQVNAIGHLATGKSNDPVQDLIVVGGGALMVANMAAKYLFPHYQLALFGVGLGLDLFGLWWSHHQGATNEQIAVQAAFFVLFNTDTHSRKNFSEGAVQVKKRFGGSFFEPQRVVDAGLVSQHEIEWNSTELHSYRQASPTLNRLIEPLTSNQIGIDAVKGKGMSFDPIQRVIQIGDNHPAWKHLPSFLISLAHELAHADDELLNYQATDLMGHIDMARYAEAYAIEKQMAVAAELYQAGLHPGYSIKIGSRTLDSKTFLNEIKSDESRDHLRLWIMDSLLMKAGGKDPLLYESYHDVYARRFHSKYQGEAHPSAALKYQTEMIDRGLADIDYSGMPAEVISRAKELMTQARAGKIPASIVSDYLMARQIEGWSPPQGIKVQRISFGEWMDFQGKKELSDEFQTVRARVFALGEAYPETAAVYRFEIDVSAKSKAGHFKDNIPLIAEMVCKALIGKFNFKINIKEKVIVCLPVPSVMMELLKKAYPQFPIQFIFSFGQAIMPGSLFQRMRGEGIFTIAQPWTDDYWPDVQVIAPPWYLNLHDFYHSADMLIQGLEKVKLASRLFEGFDGLELPRELDDIKKLLMDLEDDELSNTELLSYFWDVPFLYFLGGRRYSKITDWGQAGYKVYKIVDYYPGYDSFTEQDPRSTLISKFNDLIGIRGFSNNYLQAKRTFIDRFPIEGADCDELQAYKEFALKFIGNMAEEWDSPLLLSLRQRIEADLAYIATRLPHP